MTKSVFVQFQACTINGNDKICDGVYFSKASGLNYRFFSGFCDRICLYFKPATKSVFSKFQTFTMNSNDRVCDAVYF